MSPRTVFLSRLIGIYAILASLSMLLRRETAVAIVTGMIHNAPVLYLTGLIGMTAGLAIILSHNVWSGGALPVVVTLVGWGSLIKGLLLMFLSPEGASGLFLDGLQYEQRFYFYTPISLVLGIYLTYASMRAK